MSNLGDETSQHPNSDLSDEEDKSDSSDLSSESQTREKSKVDSTVHQKNIPLLEKVSEATRKTLKQILPLCMDSKHSAFKNLKTPEISLMLVKAVSLSSAVVDDSIPIPDAISRMEFGGARLHFQSEANREKFLNGKITLLNHVDDAVFAVDIHRPSQKSDDHRQHTGDLSDRVLYCHIDPADMPDAQENSSEVTRDSLTARWKAILDEADNHNLGDDCKPRVLNMRGDVLFILPNEQTAKEKIDEGLLMGGVKYSLAYSNSSALQPQRKFCKRCCKFDTHFTSNCRSVNAVCRICGGRDHEQVPSDGHPTCPKQRRHEECPSDLPPTTNFCIHCRETGHLAGYRNCKFAQRTPPKSSETRGNSRSWAEVASQRLASSVESKQLRETRKVQVDILVMIDKLTQAIAKADVNPSLTTTVKEIQNLANMSLKSLAPKRNKPTNVPDDGSYESEDLAEAQTAQRGLDRHSKRREKNMERYVPDKPRHTVQTSAQDDTASLADSDGFIPGGPRPRRRRSPSPTNQCSQRDAAYVSRDKPRKGTRSQIAITIPSPAKPTSNTTPQ